MKPFWVYILRCADGSYYTGHTDNLEHRIAQHQIGAYEGYTAKRCPVELVWSQECTTREEALSAELQIKGWSRKKKEAMMRGDWDEVSRLARSKSAHASTVRQAHSSARTDLQDLACPKPGIRQNSPEHSRRAYHDGLTTTVRPELVEGQEEKDADHDS